MNTVSPMLSTILVVIISPYYTFLVQTQISRDNRVFPCCVYSIVHFSINNSVLHIYHQNNFEDPFYHSEEKGLFHVFFPHDCHLHLLLQLHFHVYESTSKGQGVFEQGGGCAKHLHSSHAEPLYPYPKESASEASLHGNGKEDCIFLKQMKK